MMKGVVIFITVLSFLQGIITAEQNLRRGNVRNNISKNLGSDPSMHGLRLKGTSRRLEQNPPWETPRRVEQLPPWDSTADGTDPATMTMEAAAIMADMATSTTATNKKDKKKKKKDKKKDKKKSPFKPSSTPCGKNGRVHTFHLL